MTRSQSRRSQRKRTRRNYLAKLAASNPTYFDARWRTLIESWVREIQYRAHHLIDENAEAVPAAYAVMDEALQLLQNCGDTAVNRLKSDTITCLSTAYQRFMKQAIDKHPFRLGSVSTENP